MLAILTLITAIVAIALPYLPGVTIFGFVPLPWPLLTVLLIVSAVYVAATELAKRVVFPVAVPKSDVHGAG